MDKTERWGVFAWWTMDGVTMAQVRNTFKSKSEASEHAKTYSMDIYDSIVVVPEAHFDECWKLIGATVVGG